MHRLPLISFWGGKITMLIFSTLIGLATGIATDTVYDALKSLAIKQYSSMKKKNLEKYSEEFERKLLSLTNSASEDRLVWSPDLQRYAMNEMVLQVELLTILDTEAEKKALRETIRKWLFIFSSLSYPAKRNSNASMQADTLISEYSVIAEQLLNEEDTSQNFRQELLSSKLYIINKIDTILKLIIENSAQNKQILSRLIAIEDVKNFLYDSLCDLRNSHPSFILMGDNRDPELDVRTERLYYYDAYGKTNIEDSPKPAWEIIQDTWKKDSRCNVILEGPAGIGKTVTLLSAADQPLIKSKNLSAIYIPLYELVDGEKVLTIDQYLENNSIPYRKEISDIIATQAWTDYGGPSLLLLLDGINEIPSNRREKVMKSLGNWFTNHKGAQFILVSRRIEGYTYDFKRLGNSIVIELEAIPIDIAKKYIQSCLPGQLLPDKNSIQWDYLIYPLFLTLYIKSGQLQKIPSDNYIGLLKIYETDKSTLSGPYTLLWNFMQRELCRKQAAEWFVSAALAYEYILPCIAWKMAAKSTLSLPVTDVYSTIEEACSYLSKSPLTTHLQGILLSYATETGEPYVFSTSILRDVVLCECNVLFPQQFIYNGSPTLVYKIAHQIFRDCLAGTYLLFYAETIKGEIPACWKEDIPQTVLDSVAELIDQSTSEKMWSQNKDEQKYNQPDFLADGRITRVLLELWKRNRLPQQLDFSGMDIRNYSIARYCQEDTKNTAFFNSPNLSQGTLINEGTLTFTRPEGNDIYVLDAKGNRFLYLSNQKLYIWNTNTEKSDYLGILRPTRHIVVLDTKHLVYATPNRETIVRNYITGEETTLVAPFSSPIYSITKLGNDCFACAYGNGAIRIWDTNTGTSRPVRDPDFSVASCLASLNNELFVCASYDLNVRIWNANTGEFFVLGKNIDVTTEIVTLGDNQFVCKFRDGTLCLWTIDTKDSICFEQHKAIEITSCSNNRFISEEADGLLYIWEGDPISPHLYGNFASQLSRIQVLQDGRVIVSHFNGKIDIWDTGLKKSHTYGHEPEVLTHILPLASGELVCGFSDGTLRVINNDMRISRVVKDQPSLRIITLEEIDSTCIAITLQNEALYEYHITTGCSRFLGKETMAITAVSHINNETIILASKDGLLGVKNIASNHFRPIGKIKGEIKKFIVMNAELVIGMTISGEIWECNLSTGLIQEMEVPDVLTCVKRINHVNFIFSTQTGSLYIRDLTHPKANKLFDFDFHIRDIAQLEDGSFVFGTSRGYIYTWKNSARPIRLGEHGSRVLFVIALPCKRFVSVAQDSSIRIWDMNTKKYCDINVSTLDVSNYDFSEANISQDYIKKLWQNGAKISDDETSSATNNLWYDISDFMR